MKNKPGGCKAPSGAIAHNPGDRTRQQNIKNNIYITKHFTRMKWQEKQYYNVVTYLFKITEMSIHCCTNSLQKFKPLLCLYIRKSCNLDIKINNNLGNLATINLCQGYPVIGISWKYSHDNEWVIHTSLKRDCSNKDLALWSSCNVCKIKLILCWLPSSNHSMD